MSKSFIGSTLIYYISLKFLAVDEFKLPQNKFLGKMRKMGNIGYEITMCLKSNALTNNILELSVHIIHFEIY